jgi:hypothetical protein
MSIKVAPKETTPSGILKRPEPIPAKIDFIVPVSSSSLFSFFSTELTEVVDAHQHLLINHYMEMLFFLFRQQQ